MATTPDKPRRRPGRPTKEEEVRRALAEIGVDPALIDPLRILAGIAANGRMPPTARVAACKALLAVKEQEPAEDAPVAVGDVAARAIKLMANARKAH
jgi:uracil-DNA glycosylase